VRRAGGAHSAEKPYRILFDDGDAFQLSRGEATACLLTEPQVRERVASPAGRQRASASGAVLAAARVTQHGPLLLLAPIILEAFGCDLSSARERRVDLVDSHGRWKRGYRTK
jgi:hypothetical protein